MCRGPAGLRRMLDELLAIMVQLEEDINSTGWTGDAEALLASFLR